jgi:hypothetical protein
MICTSEKLFHLTRDFKQRGVEMKIPKLHYVLAIAGLAILTAHAHALVVGKGSKLSLEDQTGYRWDITQARSIGFDPHDFQYGIGKDAFEPLDDTSLKDDVASPLRNPRVIGIAAGSESKAYSIDRLRYHEIANSSIDGVPIAAGY